MKKTILMGAAAAAMLSLAACSGNGSCNGATCTKDLDKVYTGVMPAADCDGIRYTLILDYDDDEPKGDYQLVETYIQSDSLSPIGYKDLVSFASEGDFTVSQKDGKSCLKLVKDGKESSASAIDTTYFIVDSDSTITMTNDQFEASSTPGMNYTLQLAK